MGNLSRVRDLHLSYIFRRGIEHGWLKSGIATELYWRYAPAYYRHQYGHNLRQAGVPIDPFKLRWINTEKLSRFSGRQGSYVDRVYPVGTIKRGEWDQQVSRNDGLFHAQTIEETEMYQAFQARFNNGVDWTETTFVQEILNRIKNGEELWNGCTSRKDVLERCAYVDNLYNKLKQHGYRTQAELRDERETTLENSGFFNEHINEIVVDIGRRGDFMLLDSKHRTCLAKILNINKVPVQVVCRHDQWVDELVSAYNGETTLDHPDLHQI